MIAVIGDTSGEAMGVVVAALAQSKHGTSGVLVIPDRPRPDRIVAPNKTEGRLVTTHKVKAELPSRKYKLIQWLLESASSPAKALEPGQLVPQYNSTQVSIYLTNIKPLELDAFKALLAEASRPYLMCDEISEDAWKDAKKDLLAELVIHHE